MSEASNALTEEIAAAIAFHEGHLEWVDLYEVIARLTVGLFLKTAFVSQNKRMEIFDEFCADLRKIVESEVAAGKAIEDNPEEMSALREKGKAS